MSMNWSESSVAILDFALAIYTGINYFFSIIIIRYRFTQLHK
jgi:hypothetical protein